MAVDVDDRILRPWDRMLVNDQRRTWRVFLDGKRRFVGATLLPALGLRSGREDGEENADNGDGDDNQSRAFQHSVCSHSPVRCSSSFDKLRTNDQYAQL